MNIFWARTEYHFEYYMTANADRNVCIHDAKPFEDETDGKEHCESQNEQQVLGSNQNDRPVNLSAQVQDVNKTCGLVYAFNLFGFTFHTAFSVDNKHNGMGETKRWQNDKDAHSDSNHRRPTRVARLVRNLSRVADHGLAPYHIVNNGRIHKSPQIDFLHPLNLVVCVDNEVFYLFGRFWSRSWPFREVSFAAVCSLRQWANCRERNFAKRPRTTPEATK